MGAATKSGGPHFSGHKVDSQRVVTRLPGKTKYVAHNIVVTHIVHQARKRVSDIVGDTF